jgi:hypothetical protein
VKVHVEVTVPPTGTVTGEGLQLAVRPITGLTVVDKATSPVNPLGDAGLPRLARVTTSVVEPAEVVNVAVVEAGVILKPLTLIVKRPDALVASPVAAWLIL